MVHGQRNSRSTRRVSQRPEVVGDEPKASDRPDELSSERSDELTGEQSVVSGEASAA